MSFEEKSTWGMLATMIIVYGWYFSTIGGDLGGDVSSIDYQGTMLVTVLAVVAIAVVFHILIAVVDPKGSDQSDERDRYINRFGEYIGGFVLTAGALAGMGMAMAEFEYFFVANTILAGLVLSEIVSGVTKIVLYRRGF